MTNGPVRPFNPRQLQIADGIDRELSYAQIGQEMGITAGAVRFHVKQMALILDEPAELPPRWRILFWIRSRQWQPSDPPTHNGNGKR